MKVKMEFVIDEDGGMVRYGESDEKLMTPDQRIAYRSMRSRYKALQRWQMEQHRAKEAKITQKLIESDPQLAAEVLAKARAS